MEIIDDFVPQFTTKEVGNFADKPWLDLDDPQVILVQGMRGAGKGVTIDNIVQRMYDEGFNIWHLWGARSLENLYYIVNKNCKEKYHNLKVIVDAFYEQNFLKLGQRCECKGLRREEFDGYLDLAIQSGLVKNVSEKSYKLTDKGHDLHFNKLLHCNCFKTIPVSWMVPNYVKVDEESVDRFNGAYWNNEKEYFKQSMEITSKDRQLLQEGKLLKPSYLRPKPLLIIRKITPPTSTQRAEVFREEFVKIILEARDEHRIVCMNPAIFEGQLDKFETIAEIFKMMKYLMNSTEHFLPLTQQKVGKARKYWTRRQKSWHKIAVVINELRSVSPSNTLSGEKGASGSKRAIFDYIPEARHFRNWLVGDYQRPDDVLPTIRDNPNITIVKNGSRNILGDSWKWLFDSTERWQIKTTGKLTRKDIKNMAYVRFMKSKHPRLSRILDMSPCVDELKKNEGYICWPNQEYKKVNFYLPSFHHKQSNESFMLDTGIRWDVDTTKKETIAKTLTTRERKQAIQNKKKQKDDIFKRIENWRVVEGKSYPQIKEELVQLQKDGVIPDIGYANKTPAYFSNEYGKWKKKQITPESE